MNNKTNKALVRLCALIILIAIIALLLLGLTYLYVKDNLNFSLDESLFEASKESNITKFYYDASYGKGRYIAKELCSINPTGNRKQWYAYADIGDNLKNAFISVEDRNFFSHHGVDVKRTAFAAINYFLHFRKKFGGSTITQQVIKNISGDSEQTVKRKLSEIIRAFHIEYSHSKEEIFEMYLNIVPMGEGMLGVGLAAQSYFGKTPDSLSIAEAATLVGITNAPTKYNPHTNPKSCIEKRNTVLASMLEYGVINKVEYESAIESELNVISENTEGGDVDSWFTETVCDDVVNDLVSRKGMSRSAARFLLLNGGLSVYTTVDPEIQKILENYFEQGENFPEAVKSGLEYSMVISDSKTGNLLAIVGGVGKKNGNRLLNYALTPRAPGSSLKPIALYAPLIDDGKANWATVFDDVPVLFNRNSAGEYIPYPKNYPDTYGGLTTLSDALCQSKNTVAVRMYKMLGAKRIFYMLKNDFGFDTLVESESVPSGATVTDIDMAPLALGQLTHGISLRKLTEAYTVFSNDGTLQKCRSYTSVYNGNGECILDNSCDVKTVFTKETARIMNKLLMRVVDCGTAKSITLKNTVDTAGKTGTSGNDIDRLFVGYTPYYTAGIWCGYSGEAQSIGYQSITHLHIWDEVMKKVHEAKLEKTENIESFSIDGLKYLPYCKDSGGMFSDRCIYDPRGERLEYGYFTDTNKPNLLCDRHILCLYDEITGGVAVTGCPEENLKSVSLLDVSERNFPIEIIVTDAEYVWRKLPEGTPPGASYDVPYFINILADGEFVGRGKNKKQFNSSCYLHND